MSSFEAKFHPEILTDSPERGHQTRYRWENQTFSSLKHQYISKMVRVTSIVTIIVVPSAMY